VPTELDGSTTVASFTNLECGVEGGTGESAYADRNRFALGGDNESKGDEVGEVAGVRRLDVRAEVRLGDEDEVDARETGDSMWVCLGDALTGVLDLEGGPSDCSRRGRECERARGATWIRGRARLDEAERLEDEAV
jgi:hypothetical protein